MVQAYNALPQCIVDMKTVKLFQRCLQKAARIRAMEGYENWQHIFTSGRRYASVLRFQSFFDVGVD